jgi:hypothetical protein
MIFLENWMKRKRKNSKWVLTSSLVVLHSHNVEVDTSLGVQQKRKCIRCKQEFVYMYKEAADGSRGELILDNNCLHHTGKVLRRGN